MVVVGGLEIDGGADGTPPAGVGGEDRDGAGETVVVLCPPFAVGAGEIEGGFDGAGDDVVFSANLPFLTSE